MPSLKLQVRNGSKWETVHTDNGPGAMKRIRKRARRLKGERRILSLTTGIVLETLS